MKNSLMKMRPELAKEWSEKNLPLTPDDVPFGSNKLYRKLQVQIGHPT